MRQVIVLPYQSEWASEYEREADRLREVFGVRLKQIHHMGSTSVPGLAAKPIIDILPVVDALEGIEQFDEPMEALGYEAKGEFGMPGRRYYRNGRITSISMRREIQKSCVISSSGITYVPIQKKPLLTEH